jgi:rhodanese-related sulfurtransferase
VAVILVAVVAVIGADVVFGAISGGGGTPTASPTATATPAAQSVSAAAPSSFGVVVPANGGSWINVTPDELAQMLQHKDFTLLNVKTPYSGEIEGTDLYIPYTQIAARASELPADRGAKILVYCRTGATSAIADQTLIDLGYTNIWNLDGGMAAWQASGRQLVNKNR